MYGLGTMSAEAGRSTGHWVYPKDQQRDLAEGRQLGRHHKTGVCESVRCLGKMQLCSLDLSVPAPSRRVAGGLPQCQAASIRPTPGGGKGGVTGNQNT